MDKKIKLLFLFVAFQIATFFDLQAQDFGVKGSAPTVYLIGGGWNFQGLHINKGSLPPIYIDNYDYGDKNFNMSSIALHGKFGIRKYLGTSGVSIEPNLLLSIGWAVTGGYCSSISQGKIQLQFISNDIIPALNIGYDFFDADRQVLGIYMGIGYWGDVFYNAKCRDVTSKMKYDISCLSNFMGRFVINAGIRPTDIRGVCVQMNASFGIGRTYKSIDCKLLDYDFQIEKPLFLFSLSFVKKYQKY